MVLFENVRLPTSHDLAGTCTEIYSISVVKKWLLNK